VADSPFFHGGDVATAVAAYRDLFRAITLEAIYFLLQECDPIGAVF